jgi:hypothetical protein
MKMKMTRDNCNFCGADYDHLWCEIEYIPDVDYIEMKYECGKCGKKWSEMFKYMDTEEIEEKKDDEK